MLHERTDGFAVSQREVAFDKTGARFGMTSRRLRDKGWMRRVPNGKTLEAPPPARLHEWLHILNRLARASVEGLQSGEEHFRSAKYCQKCERMLKFSDIHMGLCMEERSVSHCCR